MSFIDDLLDRIVALEKQALDTVETRFDVYGEPYTQNEYPYLSNWNSGYIPTRQSVSTDLVILEFTGELVTGTTTEGKDADGKTAALVKVNRYIPLLHHIFRKNPTLRSGDYPETLPFLRSAVFTSGRGIVQIEGAEGVPAKWATYFVVTCEVIDTISQQTY